ncbi:hypothetical protein QR680_000221 [Steinernema hermaphroditum]|uniref:Delta-like protein n=1 Tax=Steinernema hermaphroditum TaxID=289476 RepID=A0AA39GTV0_9BILA|nr:hypothetical protein QR680_000221 [Steinernema hermaphroditum]
MLPKILAVLVFVCLLSTSSGDENYRICIGSAGFYRCYNGGACRYRFDECTCPTGFSGQECLTNINDCEDIDCGHGICIDGLNSYTCECDDGYKGVHCEDDIDECADNTHKCANNGTCVNSRGSYGCECVRHEKYKYNLYFGTLCQNFVDPCRNWPFKPCGKNAECVPNASGFTCHCNLGYQGEDCSVDIDECEKGTHNCQNGATCVNVDGSYYCQCKDEWLGEHCDIKKDACEHNRCTDGATCVSTVGGYRCACPPGKIGTHCTLNDPCLKNPCGMDGHCLANETNGKFECACSPGVTGPLCNVDIDECEENPCQNNGTCENRHGSYICGCEAFFYGEHCEKGHSADGITDNLNICAGFNCTTKAGNGECDHECNSLVCGYDGGDCSVDGHNFLPDCPFAGFCMRVFKDGHCDPKCNVKECHFDGYDCDKNVPKCSHSYAEFCINSYGDGTCQRMCNNRGCGWDGGDCLKTPTTLAQFGSNWVQNHLAIAIRTSPWDLYLRMNRLRMFLSSRLKAVVTVVVDEFDRPLIYEWSPEELAHKQITWNQKSLANYANDAYGVLVKFSLDVTVCFEEHIDWKECVNSIQQAVNILDTLSIREQFRDSGFDVKDISAVKDRRMGECDWRITENCWRAFGDGMCDKECNTVGCGFDGGDCLREAEKDEKYVLPGYLTVIALSNDINVDISRILMRLSKQLRAVVSVAIRNNAQPLIYRWSSSNFSGELIDLDREKRASNTTLNPFQQEQKGLVNQGYLIKLKVDTSVCHQWGWTKCIPDVYSAAAKLNKFVKKNLQLYLIYASELDLESTSSNLTVIHYIALCSIIFSTSVTVIFITYVVITVRRNRLYRNSFQNISLHFKASEPDIVTIQEPGEERNHLVSLASRCDDA